MADALARWSSLVPPGPAADALGRVLLVRYGEPHRAYHDLAHLTAVLDALDLLAGSSAPGVDPIMDPGVDLTAVRLAAWFHDAVHDGRARADEDASAALARATLPALGVAPGRVAEIARLVELTASHDPAPDDPAGALLCDADLAVLGGDPASYAAYVAAVRREYAHVPEAAFRAGRADVLRGLLALDPLYRTAEGQRRWESAARTNLTAELVDHTRQV